MITRVLVANRGEIARRVFTTCRRLGIGTVAVYTEHDADSPHVAEADARVCIDSYLDAEALLAAARAAGADAVHPGYGFLSENAGFAMAVVDAGLTWIGPPAAAVRAMGSKIEAKKMMAAAGVPVLAELDPAAVRTDELPVLIKASAGGGGVCGAAASTQFHRGAASSRASRFRQAEPGAEGSACGRGGCAEGTRGAAPADAGAAIGRAHRASGGAQAAG